MTGRLGAGLDVDSGPRGSSLGRAGHVGRPSPWASRIVGESRIGRW